MAPVGTGAPWVGSALGPVPPGGSAEGPFPTSPRSQTRNASLAPGQRRALKARNPCDKPMRQRRARSGGVKKRHGRDLSSSPQRRGEGPDVLEGPYKVVLWFAGLRVTLFRRLWEAGGGAASPGFLQLGRPDVVLARGSSVSTRARATHRPGPRRSAPNELLSGFNGRAIRNSNPPGRGQPRGPPAPGTRGWRAAAPLRTRRDSCSEARPPRRACPSRRQPRRRAARWCRPRAARRRRSARPGTTAGRPRGRGRRRTSR